MEPNRCYVTADLKAHFEQEYAPSRGTVRNRLEALHDQGRIARVKHENDAVTYRPAEPAE
jgi:Fe2+ or Zn2+ uptake regulation protein